MTSRLSRPFQIRLPLQILAVVIAIAALAAAAVGAPAIWLARQQLDRQAEARLEGGQRAFSAGLDAGLSDLSNLALLIAQRPTLAELVAGDDRAALADYLQTLQSSVQLDLLAVCLPGDSQPLGAAAPNGVCSLPAGTRLAWLDDLQPPGYLLAVRPLPEIASTGAAGRASVVAGKALNAALLAQLRRVSGIDALLLIDGHALVDGFTAAPDAGQALGAALPALGGRAAVTLDGERYLARRDRYGDDGRIEIISALSTQSIAAAQSQLTRAIGLGIVIVILAASALAWVLSQHISRPLERLRVSAIALRKGDLVTPVSADTRVREIAQVSYALEDARLALYHTLEALRREKDWNDALLGSISEGVVTLDRSGRITFFSHGAEKLSGLARERAIGRHIDEVFLPAIDAPVFSAQLPAKGGKRSVAAVQSGGRRVALAVTAADLIPPEARRVGTALVLRDVSDEEAVRRVLGDFMANITHEFRTPLSALAASIELMLDQLPDLSEAELRELLDSLRWGTLSLQTLIAHLLEGASIEAGRFRVQPRPIDLAATLDEACRVMQPLLEKYRQTLALDVPPDLPPVSADPRRTGQALINLLSNAIKWSPEGAALRLSARLREQAVTVTVTDCGPGIPPEHLRDVFIRFAHLKIDDPRAAYGAGLGLSVVKAIVEAQGGQIWAENAPEGGAAFSFTMPAA